MHVFLTDEMNAQTAQEIVSTYWVGTSRKAMSKQHSSTLRESPNNALQVTFDPAPIFAGAKTGAASNAPELRR